MKSLCLVFLLVLHAGGANAACMPPAGLTPQQWMQVCEVDLREAWLQGSAQRGITFPAFGVALYQMFGQVQAAAAAAAPMLPAPVNPYTPRPQLSIAGQCTLGETQCFNGWLRTCRFGGIAPMWQTGAQRCR